MRDITWNDKAPQKKGFYLLKKVLNKRFFVTINEIQGFDKNGPIWKTKFSKFGTVLGYCNVNDVIPFSNKNNNVFEISWQTDNIPEMDFYIVTRQLPNNKKYCQINYYIPSGTGLTEGWQYSANDDSKIIAWCLIKNIKPI